MDHRNPPYRPDYEDREMVAYVAGHIRSVCRYPSGQARLGLDEATNVSEAAIEAMRSWNFNQRRRGVKIKALMAPAPGEPS